MGTKMNQLIGRVKFGFMFGMLVFCAGCLKTNNTSTTTNTKYGYITMMNLAPYSSSAILLMNNSAITSSISPGGFTPTYNSILPGYIDFQFNNASNTLLAKFPSNFYDSLSYYSMIMYDSSVSSVNALRITDDYSVLNQTNTFYRFFSMTPDAPPVDLYFNNILTLQNRQALDIINNPNLTSFMPLTGQSYKIQAKKAGTDSLVTSLNSVVNLAPGSAYTILLTGKSDSLYLEVQQAVQ